MGSAAPVGGGMVAQVEGYVWMRQRTTVGTAISRPRYARCAHPRIDPFLTCLGRYLLNGSNLLVNRGRVIADVTLVLKLLSTFLEYKKYAPP